MPAPISVQLYSLRERCSKDFFAVLKDVAKMGYDGVEFAGMNGKTPAEVATLVRELGLKASGAHVPFPSKDNIQTLAADAKTLGYNNIVSGFGPDDMKTEDAAKACAHRFAQAAELAASVGLSFSIHNHWWEFDHQFNGKTPYEIIMEGSSKGGSELDIYWSCKGGADTVAVLRRWSKRVPLLHVKDGDLGPDNVHKAVGDGKVPIKAIVQAADPKVLQWMIVELDACATDMTQAVAKSCRWLKANI